MPRFDLPDTLRQRLCGRRLIFTVTTGRSGTNYLADVLAALPGVACFHEPAPAFSECMRDVQEDSRVAYRFWIEHKLPAIASRRERIYIETDHAFCKGFLEPLLDLGVVPDLIILSRPMRAVASSMYQLNSIPCRTEAGLRYWLHPEDPGVLPLPDWRGLDDYQLCYWYCLEIARRAERYQRLLSGHGRVVRVGLAELTTPVGVSRLVSALELPAFGWLGQFRLRRVARRRVNDKRSRKRRVLPTCLDELEREVIRRVAAEHNHVVDLATAWV